ncbi:MAG: nickel transporter [Pseudomonadota bacterium]|nr:nickel transporter [Pseudomonadota bacterium]
MLHELPASWAGLCAVALLLGLRHGLDADHLATVDGLTRYNAQANPQLAGRAGALFALGHGAVVVIVALLASTLARQWQTPAWLETTGTTVSIAFLFGLAFLNLRAVVCARPGEVVRAVGFRAHLLSRFFAVKRAWAVAAVGVLFALSFDTISQAALFAFAAGSHGGVGSAVALAMLFGAGMLAVDGANGVWISRLVGRADRTAALASRIMAWTVAGISFVVGLLMLGRVMAPAFDAWSDRHGLGISAAVLACMLVFFALALRAARRSARSTLEVSAPDACCPTAWQASARTH